MSVHNYEWIHPLEVQIFSRKLQKGGTGKAREFSTSGTMNSMNKKLSASNHISCKKYEEKLKVVQNVMYLHVTDSTFPPWMLQVSIENRKRKSKNGPSEHHTLFIDALAAQQPRYKGKDFAKELGLVTHLSFGDGSACCLHYEVGPEGVEQLQHDQKQVEDPPGWVGPYNLPTLKQGGV